jgi:membrane-associated protease RseP (regulator of RpoE activity)
MAEKSSNRTLWIILIIVGLLVSCGVGTLLGGLAGYAIGRNASANSDASSESDAGPRWLVPQQDVPIPEIPLPELAEELPPLELIEWQGALVVEVVEDSPASAAGLRVGDVIVAVDEQELNEAANLADIIAEYEPNDRIKLRIVRQGRERTISVTLGQAEDGDGPWLGIRYRAIPPLPEMKFEFPKQQFDPGRWSG